MRENFPALNYQYKRRLAACSRRALAPRLDGFNMTTDLMQVGKVVTGQQSYHHRQGLRATLTVLPAAFEVRWRHSPPPRQIECAQRPEYSDKFGRLAFIVAQGGYPSILPEAQNSRLVLAKDQPEAISINPFAIGEMADDFVRSPFPLSMGPTPLVPIAPMS